MIVTAVILIVLLIWGVVYLKAMKQVLQSKDDIDFSMRPGEVKLTKRSNKQ